MKNSKTRTAATAATEADPRWAKNRGARQASDGHFVYSVKTTGVYCRPSCAARLANPANVRFHATPAAARAAGFRACKRCKPDLGCAAPHAAKVAEAARRIAASEDHAVPDQPGGQGGSEPASLPPRLQGGDGPDAQRLCRRPSRQEGARGSARRAPASPRRSMTRAIIPAAASMRNPSRCSGMTPSRYQAPAARDEEIRFAIAKTSLGALLVAASDKGVCAILAGRRSGEIAARSSGSFQPGASGGRRCQVRKAGGAGGGPGRASQEGPGPAAGYSRHRVPAARVESADRDPGGQDRAAMPKSPARSASPRRCARWRRPAPPTSLAIAIPCHRVVKTDGGLSGYRWGVARKKELLAREEAA